MTKNVDLKRDTILQFSARATMAVLGLITLVALSQTRGVAVVGTYYLGLTVAFLASRAAGGLGAALRKRASELDANPRELFTVALLIHLCITIVFGIVLVGAYGIAPDILPPVKFTVSTFAVAVTLGAFYLGLDTYSGMGYPGRSIWFDVLRSAVQFGAFIPLFFLGAPAPQFLGANAVASVIALIAILYEAGLGFEIPSWNVTWDFLEFARWSIPTAFVSNAYAKYDVILLGALMTATTVGYYESAMRLALPARFIASSIHNVISVQTSQQSSRGGEAGGLFESMNIVGIIAIPLFWGGLAIGDLLLPVAFGPDFAVRTAFVSLVGVMGFRIFSVYVVPFQGFFQGLNRPRLVFKTQLYGLLVNIPISAALTYRYGVIGVIIGTLLVEAGMLVRYQFAHRQFIGDFAVSKEMGMQFLCGVGMWAVLSGLREVTTFSGLSGVLVLLTVGGAVYGVSLLTVSPSVRDISQSAIRSVRN